MTRGEDGRSARLEAMQLQAEGLRRLVSGGDWQGYLALQAAGPVAPAPAVGVEL